MGWVSIHLQERETETCLKKGDVGLLQEKNGIRRCRPPTEKKNGISIVCCFRKIQEQRGGGMYMLMLEKNVSSPLRRAA